MLNALVEICTSTNDNNNEIIKQIRLIPKTIFARFILSTYSKNIVITLVKKLMIAMACMFFINRSLFLKLDICKLKFSEGLFSKAECSCLIKAAMAKYRALYANMVKEIAGNSSAGILMVNCIADLFLFKDTS